MYQYCGMAQIYDSFMNDDIDYNAWADYLTDIFSFYGKTPHLIADLACGTGNISIPMSKRGYEVIGVDISTEMLDRARKKSSLAGQDILFLNQDITKLDLYGSVDAVLCMIDGINYITDPGRLKGMFKRLNTCFLNPGAVVVFDVSSVYKLSKVLGNNTFIYDTDDIYYGWQNSYIRQKRLCQMDLSFFIKSGTTYQRFDETHLQRAYSVRFLKGVLTNAGFTNINVFGELTFDKPRKSENRIVFTAQKPENAE